MDHEEQRPTGPAREETSRNLPHLNYRDSPCGSAPLDDHQEAAEYLGYDIKHVRRLARQSKIGAVKERDRWIDVDQFTAYLNMMLDSEDGWAGPRPAREEAP